MPSEKDGIEHSEDKNALSDVKTFSFSEAKQIGDALGLHRGSLGVEQSTMGLNTNDEGREGAPGAEGAKGGRHQDLNS